MYTVEWDTYVTDFTYVYMYIVKPRDSAHYSALKDGGLNFEGEKQNGGSHYARYTYM